ncbi:hypothetical protein [Profundibacterium mesophilum]|uniref:Uncharacterized protein n=1 Tax=Profundibacterium mesophilum KAUST100406-0324 TaxID=1037889 RepID=A0A921TCB8_9RHOB|nr:hypothetical protein [Profundibacterium mesophilum]KAF0674941.1 hypothetical protein PMES_02649 [Profundibacterium mesophilum KAUST100406-0324]
MTSHTSQTTAQTTAQPAPKSAGGAQMPRPAAQPAPVRYTDWASI